MKYRERDGESSRSSLMSMSSEVVKKKNARPSPTPLLPCMPTMALRDCLRRIQAPTSLSDGGRSVLEKEAGREDPFWPQNSDGNFRHWQCAFEFSLIRRISTKFYAVTTTTPDRCHHCAVLLFWMAFLLSSSFMVRVPMPQDRLP